MKLPLRATGTLVLKALDVGLTLAIRFNQWLDDRKARKKGLTFKDVQHQQDQIARATRSTTKTVILPRRREP